MTELHTDPRVDAYLTEVRRAVAAIDPTQAEGIVAELAEHVRQAADDAERTGTRLDVRQVLRELGDPALIAAAVERPASAPAPASETRSATTASVAAVEPAMERIFGSPVAVIVTLLMLLTGMLVSPLVSLSGLILLWCSPRWTIGDKLVGTVLSPVVLVFGLPFLSIVSGPIAWSFAMSTPLIVVLFLLLRLRRRKEDGAARVLQVPRAGAHEMPRHGVLGRLDRWPAATVVIAAAPVGLLVVVASALATRSWAWLPVTASIAAALVVIGIAVLSASRGWSAAERTVGFAAIATTAGALALVVTAVSASVSVIEVCTGDQCRTIAPALPDAAALLDPIARYVLLPMVFAAGWTAARFRAAGSIGPTGTATTSRNGSFAIAGLVVMSAVVPPAVVMMSTGNMFAAVLAVAAIGAWLTGVVLVLRSASWTAVDRWLVTVPVPALLAFSFLFLIGPGGQPVTGHYASYPAEVPFDAASMVLTLGLVCLVVQVAIAIRLLVARRSASGGVLEQPPSGVL